MLKCEHCPLIGTDKVCPSVDYSSLCGHIEREAGQPGYWTSKLLRQSGTPAPASAGPAPKATRQRPANLSREIVVSRYREDTRWVNDCPVPAVVYEKEASDFEYDDKVIVRYLPNTGREAGTILNHIVSCYHSLADLTFTTQGYPHGMVDLFDRVLLDYTRPTPLATEYKYDFPGPATTSHDLVSRVNGYEVRYGDAAYIGERTPEKNVKFLGSVWSHWFTCRRPKKWWFPYAGEMAIPKRAILSRPLEFWVYARDQVDRATTDPFKWDSEPTTAWAVETLWLYLLDARYPVRMPRRAGCGCGHSRRSK